MRLVKISFVAMLGLTLLPAFGACDKYPDGGTTSASSTGAAPNCDAFYDIPSGQGTPCLQCLKENCCAETVDCGIDCKYCFYHGDAISCSATVNEIYRCAAHNCVIPCSNPAPSTSSGSSSGGGGAGGSG